MPLVSTVFCLMVFYCNFWRCLQKSSVLYDWPVVIQRNCFLIKVPVVVVVGWGSFHLGFSNTSDPEPGRCRRTDGKKWRCSRDAVADQKYCERHMNRGRHRSRKPVEGQTGHPVSGATNTTSSTKQLPTASSASAATVVPSGGASNSLTIAHQQVKSLQAGVLNLTGDASMRRYGTLFS